MIAIVLHGGCYDIPPGEEEKRKVQKGLDEYGEIGFAMLKEGKSALDAVEKVISLLEDDPIYDAGTGSFPNLSGEAEMDALIMDSSLRCGGVQCIKNVRNPIAVARLVMEKTPHNLLSGSGAEQFARTQGIPFFDPIVNGSGENTVGAAAEATAAARFLGDIQSYGDFRQKDKVFSTVGAAALDQDGMLVAATSTGGIRKKMPGRVGDSAIPGAGTFCNDEIALSATGEGEGIMTLCLTHRIALEYQAHRDVTEACKKGIALGSANNCICGIIALTKDGVFSWAHNGCLMPVYWKNSSQ